MNKIKLAQLVEIKKGKKVVELSSFQEGAYRYIQIGDLRNNLSLKYTLDNSGVLVGDEDVLIAWDGANAGTIGFGLNGVIGSTIAAIKIKPEYKKKILSTFLGQFLKGKSKLLRDKATGATIPHIQKSELLGLELGLPTIDTQKKIANTLDLALELIEKRKEQIAEMDKLIQNVFYEMFGDPYLNKKSWKIRSIKEVTIKTQYGTSNKASEEKLEFPILRMNNISYSGNMSYSSMKYINLDDKDKEKYLVHKGELLFNRTNSKELVGKTGLFELDTPMAFAGYLIKIIPSIHINPKFMVTYMNTDYIKKVLFNMAKSIVGMANINAKELESIPIIVPPLELQDKFASIVEEIESQKKVMEESLHEMENNFNALMQKAFRGELFPEE